MRDRIRPADLAAPTAGCARTAAGRTASQHPSALALQRAIGNRAFSSLVANRRSLQRSCSDDHGCGCGECSEKEAGDSGGVDAGATATATPTTPAIKKTVNVFPISLGSSTRDPYVDIRRADAIWSACGVKVNALIGVCSTSNVLDTTEPKNVLNEFSDPMTPTAEETAMLALRPGPASALHAYYVPRMSAGSRGEAFTPTDNKISAVVISDSAASDSLAHEIGHVLLDSGAHTTDPDELMASGTIRNVGVDKITATQCTKATS